MKLTRRKIESRKTRKTRKTKTPIKQQKSRKMRGGDTIEYPDEGVYEGDVRIDGNRKIRHGRGKMTYNEDDEYNEDNLIEYDGDWVDDKIQGNGKMIYDEDSHNLGYSEYNGEWMNGMPNGKGTMKFANDASEYDGDWVNGKMEGKGKMKYDPDSELNEEDQYSEYDGDWVAGKKEGWGKMTFLDGRVFEENWEDDKPDIAHALEQGGLESFEGDWTDVIWYELDGNEIMVAREEEAEAEENSSDEGSVEEFNTPLRENRTRAPSPVADDDDLPPRNVAIRRRNPRRNIEYEDDAYDPDAFQRRPETVNLMDRFEFDEENNEAANVPFEVHRAAGKINLDKYLEIIGSENRNYQNVVEYVKSKFLPYINENFGPNEAPQMIEKLNKILARFSSAAELSQNPANIKMIGNTVDFAFKQPKEFIDFYVRAFIQDCYHAYEYEGDAGMSCVAGILERFYMIVGDAAFAMCPDGNCEKQEYIELLKLFNKHIDKNELTQEWANTYLESEELRSLKPQDRKQHYINFMKQKYAAADMLDANTEKIINDEADNLESANVFDKLQFGGKKKRRSIKNRNMQRKRTKKIYKNKKNSNSNIKKRKTMRRKINKLSIKNKNKYKNK